MPASLALSVAMKGKGAKSTAASSGKGSSQADLLAQAARTMAGAKMYAASQAQGGGKTGPPLRNPGAEVALARGKGALWKPSDLIPLIKPPLLKGGGGKGKDASGKSSIPNPLSLIKLGPYAQPGDGLLRLNSSLSPLTGAPSFQGSGKGAPLRNPESLLNRLVDPASRSNGSPHIPVNDAKRLIEMASRSNGSHVSPVNEARRLIEMASHSNKSHGSPLSDAKRLIDLASHSKKAGASPASNAKRLMEMASHSNTSHISPVSDAKRLIDIASHSKSPANAATSDVKRLIESASHDAIDDAKKVIAMAAKIVADGASSNTTSWRGASEGGWDSHDHDSQKETRWQRSRSRSGGRGSRETKTHDGRGQDQNGGWNDDRSAWDGQSWQSDYPGMV